MKSVTKDEIQSILRARFANDTHKSLADLPLPSVLKDTQKAAKRIKKAIESNEQIAVVGDYDVDGIVSCVIMAEFFDELSADYVVKIPNRFKDGYGLNADIANELNASLIITVDNGIGAVEAAELCAKKGVDLIITDHHIPPAALPKAYAIINPKQENDEFPDIEICGAQVAWYLLAALKEACKIKFDLGKFLDLLAIAIMADMMELRDLNRVLVREGIKRINSSKRPAFRAIKQLYQKDKFSLDNISFLIAPLINSAGRMNDANVSFEFLYTRSFEKACKLLGRIVAFNNERKSEEKRLFEESLSKVGKDDSAVVVSGAGWHEGVLGIVASRLARHFGKPAFVFSEFEDKAKGSARSVGQIDIIELCETQKELFLSYGGHKGAGGMLIELKNLPALKANLNALCKQIEPEKFVSNDEILGILPLKSVDFELLEILENFEPFGHKNPRPFFAFENVRVKSAKILGKEGRHLKLVLSDESLSAENGANLSTQGNESVGVENSANSSEKSDEIFSVKNSKNSNVKNDTRNGANALSSQNNGVEALFFDFDKEINEGELISFIANVSKNEFGGVITAQLIIKNLI